MTIDRATSSDTRYSSFGRYPEALNEVIRIHQMKSDPKGLIIGIADLQEPMEYLAAARSIHPDTSPKLTVSDIVDPGEYRDRLTSAKNFPVQLDESSTNPLRKQLDYNEGASFPNSLLMDDIRQTLGKNYIHTSISQLADKPFHDLGFEGGYDYLSCQNVLIYITPSINIPILRNKEMIKLWSRILEQLLAMLSDGGTLSLYHDSMRPEILAALELAANSISIPLRVLNEEKMIFKKCEKNEQPDLPDYYNQYQEGVKATERNLTEKGNVFGI